MSIKCRDMELAIANFFNYRQNIIVPNVSWGAGLHECDILVIKPSGIAIEVEIKVSLSDLKKDLEKKHKHKSKHIRMCYFAIPDKMIKHLDLIPERFGVIVVKDNSISKWQTRIERPATINKASDKMSQDKINKIMHLGTMRIWSLKDKNRDLKLKLDSVFNKIEIYEQWRDKNESCING